MEQKQEEDIKDKKTENEEKDEQDLDDALDHFDDKLNLTAGEDDIRNIIPEDIDKEYMKFMENMQNKQEEGGNEQMPQFENMLSGLLNELGGGVKGEGQGPIDPKDGENLENIFKNLQQGLGGNQGGQQQNNEENNPQFENFANSLLNEFMEKEIIYEPLQDARKEYDCYLSSNQGSIGEEDLSRYLKQRQLVDDIITTLDTQPDNKDKIITMFEQMQDYGNPPQQLANAMGKDSPFEMFNANQNQANQDCLIF